MMDKPKVESIEGLSPSISIEQKTTSRNPRSTVGTVTEIYDYLRVLYARVGTPYSPATGLPIEAQTVSNMVDRIMKLEDGQKIILLAPIAKEKKGEFQTEFQKIRKDGFQRVKVDGNFYTIDKVPKLEKNFKHDIDIVIDRLISGSIDPVRLADSIETALHYSGSLLIVEFADNQITNEKKINKSKNDTHERLVFSTKFACPVSGFSLGEIEPRLFSFNSPIGACKGCDGIGNIYSADPKKIVPDEGLSIIDGAIKPWRNLNTSLISEMLEPLLQEYGFSLSSPWKDIDKEIKDIILYGSKKNIEFTKRSGTDALNFLKPFDGIVPMINQAIKQVKSRYKFRELFRYQSLQPCGCLLYTSPSPRDGLLSRMPSSA